MLTLKDVNLEKLSLLALNAVEKETYKLLLTVYKEDFVSAKQVLNTI
jgi:hypothetical protein